MNQFELLQALNPIPQLQGDPGLVPAGNTTRRHEHRFVAMAAFTVAALLLSAGMILTRQPDRTLEVATSATIGSAAVGVADGGFVDDVPIAAIVATSEPAVAAMSIPSIDLDATVGSGVDLHSLREGPGHYRTSSIPGQAGNVAIAGHRTTHGSPFTRIDELTVGDSIYLTTSQGTFEYQVTGTEIVTPDSVDVLDDLGDNRLTLTSEHPRNSTHKRIIVTAQLIGDPAPPEPPGA